MSSELSEPLLPKDQPESLDDDGEGIRLEIKTRPSSASTDESQSTSSLLEDKPTLPLLQDDIGLTLGSYLTAADKHALASVSRDSLKFVIALERNYMGPLPQERPITAPNPHYHRNKYRAQWGRFFEILPGYGLVAPEDHTEKSSRTCPIIKSDGSRFLKLNGMIGQSTGAGENCEVCLCIPDLCALLGRSLCAVACLPHSLIQCGAILAGCAYGSYLDASSTITSEQPPTTTSRKKAAVEWADAFNPCGAEPDMGYQSDCSIINPPAPGTSRMEEYTCINQQGDFQYDASAYSAPCNEQPSLACCCIYSCCALPFISIRTACMAPMAICSCVGYVCGYGYGALTEQREAISSPPPPSQQML